MLDPMMLREMHSLMTPSFVECISWWKVVSSADDVRKKGIW